MARRAKHPTDSDPNQDDSIRGEDLEPIGVVERELTRPDGAKVRVEVPVYPPFQLRKRPPPKPEPARRRRSRSAD